MALLSLWVVFYHPLDYPRHVVVREQRVGPGGHDIEIAPCCCLYESLEDMHEDWDPRELHWLGRHPDDEPAIVGVWL